MRIFITFSCMLIASFMLSCQSNTSNDVTIRVTSDIQESKKNIVDKKVIVVGMTCIGCEKTIEAGLLQLSGINSIDANFKDSTVLIQIDTTIITLNEIQNKISELGYSMK